MKVRNNHKSNEVMESSELLIEFNSTFYRINETNQKELKITKVNDNGNDTILIIPCNSNQVKIK